MISSAAKAIRDTLVREVADDTPIAIKRERWETASKQMPTPDGVQVRKVNIGGVACLQCTPDKQSSNTVIVYCHGGGLVEGSAETFRVWTSRLALHLGCRVINIDYRLAPEHPYPAALNDVLQVCHALPINKAATGVDAPEGFCIGADSTGCVLGLLALLKLKRTSTNFPSSAFFLSPSIDLTFSSTSFSANASRDRVASLDVLKQYATLYAGELLANFKAMPPTLVMVDDSEILLDDAKHLANKITASGGLANLLVLQGLWHVWPAWGDFPESVSALNEIKQHVLHTRNEKQ